MLMEVLIKNFDKIFTYKHFHTRKQIQKIKLLYFKNQTVQRKHSTPEVLGGKLGDILQEKLQFPSILRFCDYIILVYES